LERKRTSFDVRQLKRSRGQRLGAQGEFHNHDHRCRRGNQRTNGAQNLLADPLAEPLDKHCFALQTARRIRHSTQMTK
jgi:hypothetical protein